METLWKAAVIAVITSILGIAVTGTNKYINILISVAACLIIGCTALYFLTPILEFINELFEIASLNGGTIEIIIKAVGITVLTEITSIICSESGFGGIGKMIQSLGSFAIIWLCIPVFNSILVLIDNILGKI